MFDVALPSASIENVIISYEVIHKIISGELLRLIRVVILKSVNMIDTLIG